MSISTEQRLSTAYSILIDAYERVCADSVILLPKQQEQPSDEQENLPVHREAS